MIEKFSKDWYIQKAQRLHSRVHSLGSPNPLLVDDTSIDGTKYKRWYSDQPYKEDFAKYFPGSKFKEWEKITFKDIMTPKVNAFISIEQQRPFEYTLVAVNEGAHTRREEVEMGKYANYFRNEALLPLEQQLAMEAAQATQGRKLNPDEQRQIAESVQQQLKTQSPKETQRYMSRVHQDVAEIAGNQALNFLVKKVDFERKMDELLLEASLTQNEVCWVHEVNGHPEVTVIEGECIDYVPSKNSPFVEKAETVIVEHRWSLERIAMEFGDEISDEELEELERDDMGFTWNTMERENTYRVYHMLWRERRKYKLVVFEEENENGQVEKITEYHDISYEPEGDEISVETKYIDEIHETWLVGKDKFCRMRPLEDQFLDPDVESPDMPYYGARHKGFFARKMDIYVSLYSIMWYRFERLLAKNKGKKTAINPGAIAKMGGEGIDKFIAYMEEHDMFFIDPKAEGQRGNLSDIVNLIKEIDLSNTTDLKTYIMILDYLDQKCGEIVGIPKQLEAQIQEREAVSNVNRVLDFSVRMLEPYYNLHDSVKKNVMLALLNKARVIWQRTPPRYLTYVLDDMSLYYVKFDTDHFCATKYGLFINSPGETYAIKQQLSVLLQRYIQNPNANVAIALRVIRSNNLAESQEYLEAADVEQREYAMQMQTAGLKEQQKLETIKQENEREKWDHDIEVLNLTKAWEQETKVKVAAITALGFYNEKDLNNNQVPDVIEQMKLILADRDMNLKELLAKHKMKMDEKKLAQKPSK